MLLAVVELIAGLGLLLLGAKLLIDGASALARRAGVSPLVIGLTVVAFGTSTPEVVVNAVSAWKGETDLAFGNVVGACAVNTGFVLALTALIRPLTVEPSIITREIPMLLLAVSALLAMSMDRVLDAAGGDALARTDGLILLLLLCVFLYYTVLQALRARSADPFLVEVQAAAPAVTAPLQRSVAFELGVIVAGLIGVGAGGHITVMGATDIAVWLGVSEVIIGLTIISFGTTLPELATCIVAARKGHSDVALGNIVGSNIYNLLFIGGLCATIRPVPIPRGGHVDLLVMAALAAALLPVSITGQRRISRGEGALLLAAYLGYVIWRSVVALTLDGGGAAV